MNLLHVALACSSEENADKFYRDLLALRKAAPKALSSSLARAIFNIDSDFSMINYMDESVRFEVFVKTGRALTARDEDPAISEDASRGGGNRRIDHVCFSVEDLRGFLDKCRAMGIGVTQVPKGDYIVTFISDFDGNLFEVKQE
jgi:catechol 2,3-dioxygenase-like lactoylglutathione lyase family enzyme